MEKSEDEFKFSSIPITLNPHIKKLFVLNTSLERLDSTLQNYPYLEELRLGGNKIQVSNIDKIVNIQSMCTLHFTSFVSIKS